MPPRPPPSPPALTVLCSIAAAIAVWVSLALDQVARGVVGRMLGVPLRGFEISPESHFVLVAVQGPAGSLGAFGWAGMTLTGTACILVLALGQHAIVGAIRAPGWLRGLSLGWVVVALLWLPPSLAVAALPSPGGPVAELYGQLGAPRAGRWAAAALGLVVLLVFGLLIVGRAVSVGRAWMRADGVEFRRRLVRTTAGWPGVVAVVLLAFGAGWSPTAWILIPCVVVLGVLQAETN